MCAFIHTHIQTYKHIQSNPLNQGVEFLSSTS